MIRKAAATVIALCLSASPLHAQGAPTTKKLTVSEASATVHKTPSVGSPVIGNAPRGTELVVTREVGSWVKVAWPSAADGAGYVRVSALSAAAAPAAKAPATTAKASPSSATAKTTASAKSATTAKGAPAAGAKTASAEPALAPVSAKAAMAPTPAVAPVAARNEQLPGSQPVAPGRTQYVAPTHILGVGAVAGGSTMGFGGSARGWKKGRLGFQLEFSRYSYDSVDLLSRASATDIAPAVLFALNDRVSDSLWVRPYVGVAGHMVRSSRTDLIFTDVTESASTFGVRGFFGAEMSMASLPQFALSADIGYYKMPEPFVGFTPGGIGFSISGHWYVK